MVDRGAAVRTFRRDGLTFDVDDVAASPERGVAVLLHGFPQDRTAWDAVLPLLTAGGLRVLALDQRGCSPGARPRGRRPYAVPELVEDVVALLDTAGVDRAHVVGHDWGGAVAWAFAGEHPGRTASLTVLSTPHPGALRRVLRRPVQLRRSSYVLAFQVPRLPERRLLADDGAALARALTRTGLAPDRVAHDVARLQEPGALTAALAWYRALAVSGPLRARRSRVPTTFVAGAHDPFFDLALARGTRDFVLGPYREVVLDAGHWLPEHRPDDVAAAVLAHA